MASSTSRSRFLVHLAFLSCFATFSARADWIAVPYGQVPMREAQRAAELTLRALADRRVATLSLHETRDRLRAVSHAAREPAAGDARRIAELKDHAVEDAAFGRREAARRNAEQAVSIATASLEVLNRDSQSARDLLDACLTIVRVDLHRDRTQAVQSAQRCRQLVPDLLPKERSHPANVIGALAEAENQLRRSGAEPLTVEVESENGASDCSVLLNGRRMGSAPYRLEHGVPGEMRVQAECGGTISRVHVVKLAERAVTLKITPERDQRIADEPMTSLTYSDADQERARLVGDATELGAELRVKQVVLAREQADGRVLVVRYDLTRSRAVASAVVPVDALQEERPALWESVTESLLREKQDVALPLAFTAPVSAAQGIPSAAAVASSAVAAPAAGPTLVPPPTEASQVSPLQTQGRGKSRGVLIAGGVLSGVGTALLVTGAGLYVRSQTLKDDATSIALEMEEDQQAAQRKYDDFKRLPLIGVGGSVLLATAVPMLMPEHGPKSRWAWVGGAIAGVAGAALIGYGAVKSSEEGGQVLGALLMSSGPVLLEIPITQLVRAARD